MNTQQRTSEPDSATTSASARQIASNIANEAVPPDRKSWIWRTAQILFLIAALVTTSIAVARNWSKFKASAAGLEPNWWLIVAAYGIVLATYAILIQSWRILIAGEGSSLKFLSAVRIWTIANLGRYIPGKVASIAALGVLAKAEGVPATAAAGAAILGTLINLGSGFGVVALSGSRMLAGLPPWFRYACLAGSAAFVVGVLLLPALLPPVAQWLARRVGKSAPAVQLPAANLWASVTINTISWFCYGWAFMLFSHAVLPGISGTLFQFVTAWTASYLVGFLFIFAPGGLFVRESALVAVLVALSMTNVADGTMLAATSRIWLTLPELVPGLVALAVSPAAGRLRTKSD